MSFIPTVEKNFNNMNAVRLNFLSGDGVVPSYIYDDKKLDTVDYCQDHGPQVICLRTESELKVVAHLREQIDLSINHKIDKDFEAKEKRKDEIGLVLAFKLHNEIIGTIRYVPMRHNLTLTETLLQQESLSEQVSAYNCWEAGRLVLDPEYRSGQDLLKKCILLSVEYLIENSDAEVLLASCTHVLSRLYRLYGFIPLAKNVQLQDTQKVYALIYASALKVREVLSKKKSH